MMKKHLFLQSIVLFVCFMFLNGSFAYDTPQWHLPEGVKARIGKGAATDIALSPDGTQLAVVTDIGVWLYNARTGTEVALLTGHTRSVNSVAYSPDGKTLASCSYNEIILWDPRVQTQKTTFEGIGGGKLIYSTDGLTLAVGVWGGVDLLNARTGEQKLSVSGHSGGDRRHIPEFAFSSDGNTLATTAGDPEDQNTIFLWNARTGRMLRTLTGHENRVLDITFSPDGKTLASHARGTTLLWDAKTGRLQQTLYGPISSSIAYSPDGETLAFGGYQRVGFWNTRTDQPQTPLKTSGHIYSVLFSDSSTLVSRDSEGEINFWDTQTGSNKFTIEGHLYFGTVALSPNGETLATSTRNQGIFLWDAFDGRLHKVLNAGNRSSSPAYSPDGNTLAITVPAPSNSSMIHLLNARDGQLLRGFGAPGVRFTTLVFSPDGKTLASASRDGRISLWNTNEGRPLRTLTGHEDFVSNITFSPDGKTLASSSYDEARLWGVNSGRLLRTLTGHKNSIGSLVFSPDGKTLASSSYDEARLWNAKTGQLQQTLFSYKSSALVYSSDGKMLATGAFGGEIFLWDAKTYQLQRTLTGHTSPIESLAFSPDGSRLISLSFGEEILLWDLDVPQPSEDTTAQQPGGVVNIPDAKLAAAVRKTLGLAATAPITKQVLQKLTELDAHGQQITNLTGLEQATQLRELNLTFNNRIGDLQPLARLNHLTLLYLGQNQISDITPLAGLTQLEELYLWGNQISDITPLKGLTKLDELHLKNNPIEDMTPLRLLLKQNPDLKLDIDTSALAIVRLNASQRPSIYWIDEKKGTLHRLTGTTVEHLSPYTDRVTSLAVDTANGKLYWTNKRNYQKNDKRGRIQRANLNGTSARIRKDLTHVPQGIALDVESSKIYLTDASGRIQQLNFDGSNFQPNFITGLNSPKAIEIDKEGGQLYWTEPDSIWRANLNGNNREEFVPNLGELGSIAIAGGKIYYTIERPGGKKHWQIRSSALDGLTPTQTLVTLRSRPMGLAVDLVGSKLYWTNANGKIQRANLNGKNIQNVVSGLRAPGDIVLGSSAAATAAAPTYAAEIPDQTTLLANYPNPFNPETWIPYQLSQPSNVKITIYNARGAVVRQLALGHQPAGIYTSRTRAVYWDGRNNQGERVASGIYFYRLQTDNISSLRKMLILK